MCVNGRGCGVSVTGELACSVPLYCVPVYTMCLAVDSGGAKLVPRGVWL